MGKTYCDEEGRPYDDSEFTDAHGMKIHVVTTSRGHTIEGWPATYTATRDGHEWRIQNIRVKTPPLKVADGEAPVDDH